MISEAEALKKCEVIYMPLNHVNGVNCDPVNGMVFKSPKTGSLFIVINSDKTLEQQERTLHHELAHIRLNHLDDGNKSWLLCELEAEEFISKEFHYEIQLSPDIMKVKALERSE